ncbi:MAG: hypothetical protein D6732_22035 [Methanobacteriota archaeon]|nr:MAG: hypothetical protein D6732_22035 [Euryarchaeota archaeon]
MGLFTTPENKIQTARQLADGFEEKLKVRVSRRDFLKSAAASLLASSTLFNILYRVNGNVRAFRSAGISSPASVSFENEMADVTLDSYMGQIPNLKPEAYHHRYIAYTDPGETLYFAVNNPVPNLIVDFTKQEDPSNPGTWYVDVFFRTLGYSPPGTVEFVFSDAPLGIEDKAKNVPEHFKLYQNYPNPFNSSTVIVYELPSRMRVDVAVYNTLLQRVASLAEGVQDAGEHSLVCTPSLELSSGVYIFILKTPLGRNSIRMVYTK